MRREHLDHLLRAASQIVGDRDLLVVGSQSVLGTWDEDHLPPAVTLSIEADLAPLDDPDETKATLIAAAIGEGSQFDRTFGYHADGVDVTTAVAPDGWRERLVIRDTPASAPGRGLCLEPHDCVVSKLYAGRAKDLEFADALVTAGFVDPHLLLERIGLLSRVTDRERDVLYRWVEARVR